MKPPPFLLGDTATEIGAGLWRISKKCKALQEPHNCIGVITLDRGVEFQGVAICTERTSPYLDTSILITTLNRRR